MEWKMALRLGEQSEDRSRRCEKEPKIFEIWVLSRNFRYHGKESARKNRCGAAGSKASWIRKEPEVLKILVQGCQVIRSVEV